jgi:hypothetical protein
MKRIIVAVALIAAGSNVVAGPLSMTFHASNKKAVASVAASKEDVKVQEEIAKRIAAVTKGASQVEASEVKQEVKKPGFFSRLYRGARRHTKKIAFGTVALVTSVLALDSVKYGKSVKSIPKIGGLFGNGVVTGLLYPKTEAVAEDDIHTDDSEAAIDDASDKGEGKE